MHLDLTSEMFRILKEAVDTALWFEQEYPDFEDGDSQAVRLGWLKDAQEMFCYYEQQKYTGAA